MKAIILLWALGAWPWDRGEYTTADGQTFETITVEGQEYVLVPVEHMLNPWEVEAAVTLDAWTTTIDDSIDLEAIEATVDAMETETETLKGETDK